MQNFENNFSDYIGSKYCVAVNNGTSALHSALLALDIKPGDEILLALIRYYAPFGMMDLYFWHDETPDRFTLSFPDPKQDMFYGLIENPGGGDGEATWTQGDKIDLTWTINPPVSGSV